MEDIVRYLGVIRHSWKTILVTTLIAGLVAVGVVVALPKTYESEARLLISEPQTSVNVFGSSLPALAAQQDNGVATQAELLRSRTLYAAVIRRLGLQGSPEALMRRVKITAIGQTSVISITAKADTPQAAADIANTLSDEYLTRFRSMKQDSLKTAAAAVEEEVGKARQELLQIDQTAASQGLSGAAATERQVAADRLASLSSKLEELTVNQQVESGWALVTDSAVPSLESIGPTPLSSGLLGLLAGLLFGIVYILFADARTAAQHAAPSLAEAALPLPALQLAGVDDGTHHEKREKQLV